MLARPWGILKPKEVKFLASSAILTGNALISCFTQNPWLFLIVFVIFGDIPHIVAMFLVQSRWDRFASRLASGMNAKGELLRAAVSKGDFETVAEIADSIETDFQNLLSTEETASGHHAGDMVIPWPCHFHMRYLDCDPLSIPWPPKYLLDFAESVNMHRIIWVEYYNTPDTEDLPNENE